MSSVSLFPRWRSDGLSMLVGIGGVLLCGLGSQWLGIGGSFSGSAPVGFYRRITLQGPLTRGQLVLGCFPPAIAAFAVARGYLGVSRLSLLATCPDGVQAFLKPIAAVAGDVVTITPDAVTVNGEVIPHSATLTHDRRGRVLPHWPWGTATIAPGEVFLLSTYHPRSWDSRYVGPVPVRALCAAVTPLWVWERKENPSWPR